MIINPIIFWLIALPAIALVSLLIYIGFVWSSIGLKWLYQRTLCVHRYRLYTRYYYGYSEDKKDHQTEYKRECDYKCTRCGHLTTRTYRQNV